jgi:hypothetical protein
LSEFHYPVQGCLQQPQQVSSLAAPLFSLNCAAWPSTSQQIRSTLLAWILLRPEGSVFLVVMSSKPAFNLPKLMTSSLKASAIPIVDLLLRASSKLSLLAFKYSSWRARASFSSASGLLGLLMLVNLRSQLQDAVAGGSHRQYGLIAPFHTDGDEDFLQLGFLPSSLAHSTMMSLLL